MKKIFKLQHKYLPIPLKIFQFIYSFKLLSRVFRFYGDACFELDYVDTVKENYDDYWLSKRSMYWHYLHFTDTFLTDDFKTVFYTFPSLFKNKKICDYGTGVGKIYNQFSKILKMTMIEKNKYCCEFLKKKFKNYTIINGDYKVIKELEIDTLIVTGGVLMYLSQVEIDEFFENIKNIKNLVIIDEGADNDTIRDNDPSIMYDFKKRLKNNNYYAESDFFICKKEKSYYKIFVMYQKFSTKD